MVRSCFLLPLVSVLLAVSCGVTPNASSSAASLASSPSVASSAPLSSSDSSSVAASAGLSSLSSAASSSGFSSVASSAEGSSAGSSLPVDASSEGGFSSASGGSLVIDHTAVAKVAQIPDAYLAIVKTMWLDIAGESHSGAYRFGAVLLSNVDSRFSCIVRRYDAPEESGEPEGATNGYLRVNRATMIDDWGNWDYSYGEEDFYTSMNAVSNTLRHLAYVGTNHFGPTVFGFGWCWDMMWQNDPAGGTNALWGVRWAGSSDGGTEGGKGWGLDDSDFALTGNHVSLKNYLDAVESYSAFCAQNGYDIRVVYTTGPVDDTLGFSPENHYQREVKHQIIRSNVNAVAGRVLFDYADILAWSDTGEENRRPWTNYNGLPVSYQLIHPSNMQDLTWAAADSADDHIGQTGALRIAKACWVMLARLAGWDGN